MEIVKIEQLVANIRSKCSIEISHNDDSVIVDQILYSTRYGIQFEYEIDALFQYCTSGLMLSSINYEELQKQFSKETSVKQIFKEIRKKLSLRERFYTYLIYMGVSGLYKNSDDFVEDKDVDIVEDDNVDIIKVLNSQKERLITLFITSSYTLLESYSKNLLSDVWPNKMIRESALKKAKLSNKMKEKFKEVIDNPNSDLSSELIEWKLSNPIQRFEVIFDAIKSQNPQLSTELHKLSKNIGIGIPFHIRLIQLKNKRNELSHDDPLYQLSGKVSEEIITQIDEGFNDIGEAFQEIPALGNLVDSFKDTVKDAMDTMNDMHELLFSIHAYPSILENILRQMKWI